MTAAGAGVAEAEGVVGVAVAPTDGVSEAGGRIVSVVDAGEGDGPASVSVAPGDGGEEGMVVGDGGMGEGDGEAGEGWSVGTGVSAGGKVGTGVSAGGEVGAPGGAVGVRVGTV